MERKIVSDVIYVHVPHPGTIMDSTIAYLTLDRPDQQLILEGQVIEVYGHDYVDDAFDFLGTNEFGQFVYTTKRTGFFTFTMEAESYRKKINLFVSPIPSYHVESTALNWYRTQFQTGTLGNCGPASVSMAIAHSTGKYVPVIDIRQTIGYRGDGGTNFQELREVLTANDVTSNQVSVSSKEDIFRILDGGHLVIALFHTGGVSMTTGDPTRNFFGKYYTDAVGHYVVIKGYSLDKKYFIIQDPIPSDWGINSVRHLDGISMVGRNRYYSTYEMMNSLRVPVVIEVVM